MDSDSDNIASTFTLVLLIAVGSLVLGLLAGLLYSTLMKSPSTNKISSDPKVDPPVVCSSNSNENNNEGNKTEPQLKPSAKLQSVLRNVIGLPVKPKNSTLQRIQSECTNTSIDIDEFMMRMYKSGFIVKRIKGAEQKLRCLKIDKQGRFSMFKNIKGKDAIIHNGSPYIVLDFSDLIDCFSCEDHKTFVMDFKQKSFLLSSDMAVDTHYLVEGFKMIVERMKQEKDFIEKCAVKFKEVGSVRSPNRRKSPARSVSSPSRQRHIDLDDDMSTINTINTKIRTPHRN
jgi:hypothetical protein